MVVMLFMLGGGGLYFLDVQHRIQRERLASDIDRIKRFSSAQLALSWGMTLRWLPDRLGWQCQYETQLGLAACLMILDKQRALLGGRGSSGTATEHLLLWQWGRMAQNQFLARRHGWLDFCPLADSLQCEGLFK